MPKKIVPTQHYIEDEIRTVAYACSDLTEWYAKNKREFPWRDDTSPYKVWISEVMLQQTRIETVLPYYRRFMAELPTIRSLAEVDEQRLLKLWEGLGYYSRAKNLKRTAMILVRDYDGFLPPSFEELRQLPGIGDYTAGAIASIAFHIPVPAVDGNVMRVLSRLLASFDDVMLPSVRKRMAELLRDVYPGGEEAGLLTEALMELGETICIPGSKPKCRACPVREECEAHKQHIQGKLPIRKNALPRKVEEKTVLLLHYEIRYALTRQENGLLDGMWCLPMLNGNLDEKSVEEELAKIGIGVRELTPLCKAKHLFSHVEWHMTGFYVECANRSERYMWETAEGIRELYAVPAAYRKYLKVLMQHEDQMPPSQFDIRKIPIDRIDARYHGQILKKTVK